jgi:hypothetical protein
MSTLTADRRLATFSRAESRATPAPRDPWLVFLLVFASELAFGLWIASRGIQPNDAEARASLALTAVYGSDPHLSAIGFNWMPLPVVLELGTTAFLPVWGGLVTSGFTFVAITALAAGASAGLLLWTCFRLGLPRWVGWSFALLVSANPMLFLYGANGMSEGVAAPFLIGAVCFVTLFWRTGERLYVGAAGITLAFAFLCVYEAVSYGIALALALAGGIFWASESQGRVRQGRWRAVEGLGLALLLPSAFVGVLWLVANAVVMGDPLAFTHGPYSSFEQNRRIAGGFGGGSYEAAGDAFGALHYVARLGWAFLVPAAALLVVRALDRRLFRVNTLALIALSLSVPLGFIAPLVYRGLSIGYLRYVMFPLFVAAGWGLFEIAISPRRRRAACVIFTGWILAAGAAVWVMSDPTLARESENAVLESVLTGKNAEQLPFENSILRAKPIAGYLERGPLGREHAIVVADQVRAFAVASNLPRSDLDRLLLTPDRRFKSAVADPRRFGVLYFLVPNPKVFPEDAIVRARPRLWGGHEPEFKLVTDFPNDPTPEQWRLYAVEPPPNRARTP